MEIEGLVRPVVEGAGLELVEVSFGHGSSRQLLRVIVESRDGRALDLDTIAGVSEKISRRLDLEDFGRGPYELEVSSPGIERPLHTPAQFGRAVGSTVRVKTATPVDGNRVHTGSLRGCDGHVVVLDLDGGERSIAFAEITSARTVADWGAELKGSRT